MSGTGNTTKSVTANGNARIDGILNSARWSDAVVTYSFPVSNAEYSTGYGAGEAAGLFAATPAMKQTAHFALRTGDGNGADDGFSIEGFTLQNLATTTATNANLRIAQTSLDPYGYGTAWAYYPSGAEAGGDIWLSDQNYDYSAPRAGNYAHLTLIHELGHAMGLEHAHSDGTYGAVPADYDAMEFTVMTYRSHTGAGTGGYTNETWGFAQSYMMLDIAALQYMYGADFTANSGDTVYSWQPDLGTTKINGLAAIAPGGNRIFATIWDGGGVDTYDLRAYHGDLQVDLAPGASSVFSATQLALLDTGIHAQGSIYNALQYKGDRRSLIENAIGGSGNDRLLGNQADNHLEGRGGDDRLLGRNGGDRLDGNAGRDVLKGGLGSDRLFGQAGNDKLFGGGDDDRLNGGPGVDRLFGQDGRDRLFGGVANDRLHGDTGRDRLFGQAGNDKLFGGGHRDILRGGAGVDTLTGGGGSDIFRFAHVSDSPTGSRPDLILDFASGKDLIDLSLLSASGFSIAFGGGFSGNAPHVSLREVGNDTRVIADTDGDGHADFRIDLDNTLTVELSDFIL